jgi:hypothetical protein
MCSADVHFFSEMRGALGGGKAQEEVEVGAVALGGAGRSRVKAGRIGAWRRQGAGGG